MTKQEEIREHYAMEFCSVESQEHCVSSDCPKDGSYCQDAYDYSDRELSYLKSKGVVIKSDRKLETLSVYGNIGLKGEWVKKVKGLVVVEELIEKKGGKTPP